MIVINEFEFFRIKGAMHAVPFGRKADLVGSSFENAVEKAAAWLYEEVKNEAIAGKKSKNSKYGNVPLHEGGRVIAIAVDFDLSQLDAVTAADAARMLGVSAARVAQMCSGGQLVSWKDGSKRMILRESIDARLADKPKAGRPRKNASSDKKSSQA